MVSPCPRAAAGSPPAELAQRALAVPRFRVVGPVLEADWTSAHFSQVFPGISTIQCSMDAANLWNIGESMQLTCRKGGSARYLTQFPKVDAGDPAHVIEPETTRYSHGPVPHELLCRPRRRRGPYLLPLAPAVVAVL